MRKIEVAEYDHAWPDLFDTERALIRHALGRVAIRIHHIGSTACNNDMEKYCDGKINFIKYHEAIALELPPNQPSKNMRACNGTSESGYEPQCHPFH